jgi:hypothetical protein
LLAFDVLPRPLDHVSYVTDIEGNWEYLLTWVQRSEAVHHAGVLKDGSADLRLAKGWQVVFGGDSCDKGGVVGGSVRVVRTLVRLKERYPRRVTLIVGNRDANKMRLTSELDEAVLADDMLPRLDGPYWIAKERRVTPLKFLTRQVPPLEEPSPGTASAPSSARSPKQGERVTFSSLPSSSEKSSESKDAAAPSSAGSAGSVDRPPSAASVDRPPSAASAERPPSAPTVERPPSAASAAFPMRRQPSRLGGSGRLTPAPDPPMWQIEAINSPINRLRYILTETMGAAGEDERRRAELALIWKRKKAALVTDDEVVRSFVESVEEGGFMRRYLQLAQLAAIVDGTLYVHGGVLQGGPDNDCIGCVPGREERIDDIAECARPAP